MRGRPKTRSAPVLQAFVWRLVREEYRRGGCASVLAACERLLQRRGPVKIMKDGEASAAITCAATLHQWYATAEAARHADPSSELALRCAAWERTAAEKWPDATAQRAYWTEVQHLQMRGSKLTAENYRDMNAQASDAADRARKTSEAPPAPRKNKPKAVG